MSQLKAKIIKIDNVENLNIITLSFGKQTIIMLGLELSSGVKVGSVVELGVKPTHVAIAKEFSGMVSFSNQLKAKIKAVENGKLLSSIKLDVDGAIFESIISLSNSKKMDLRVSDEVIAFIRASEFFIKKVFVDD